MADRIIVWHISTPGETTARYYIERDCEPVALRLYAENAPGAGDLTVDILDDGVSIMKSNNHDSSTFESADAYIEYRTLTSNFTMKETVTGGTSSATGVVIKDNRIGTLTLENVSGTFTVGETITGASSGATAVVTAYVIKVARQVVKTVSGQSHAILPKNANSDDAAADFKDGVYIAEGSWLSVSLLDAAGASGITVQLELNALSESLETRHWAE